MASETSPRTFRAKSSPKSALAASLDPATLGVVGLALAAAVGASFVLPRAEYSAAAVVGVEGGPASLRPAMIQAAADAARSRQVAVRAASVLPAKFAMRPEALAAALQVDAGRVPGTLVLRAGDGDAERAASLASALAGALVAELEERATATGRDNDAADALKLSRLNEIAGEAHRKLAALGGDATGPVLARTSATTRAETLRARLDAIRSILAAGNPPLGAGRDVPPTIEALQTGYLDLTRQLAKARETLGERHTTVVGLQESVRHSAAELTAAWGRLAKATEQELGEARTAATAKVGLDPKRAAALDAARATARLADDAVARAATPRDDDEARWHLIARASAPALADGLGLPLRVALAATAGLLVLLLGLWSIRRPRKDATLEIAEANAAAAEPSFFDENAPLYEACVEEAILPETTTQTCLPEDALVLRPRLEPAFAEPPFEPIHTPVPSHDERELADMLEEDAYARPSPIERDLVAALVDVLPAIDAVAPRAGVPIVMVATDEAAADTNGTALALGAAAATAGRRVLIVEAHARPALAAAAASDAEPALIDVLGETRIVLRAENGAGQVYVAPAFADGARLAADLVRAGTALVADDVADEFDLVVVDGGRVREAAALAAEADAVLRVVRVVTPRVAGFLAALGVDGSFLGTVVTADPMFMPPVAAPRAATPPARARAPLGPHPLRRPPQVEARRRVGAR